MSLSGQRQPPGDTTQRTEPEPARTNSADSAECVQDSIDRIRFFIFFISGRGMFSLATHDQHCQHCWSVSTVSTVGTKRGQ
jgi:hypothetical protein